MVEDDLFSRDMKWILGFKHKTYCGLGGHQTINHMQQPTKNSTNDGEGILGILEEIRPRWNVGGGLLLVFMDRNLFHDK